MKTLAYSAKGSSLMAGLALLAFAAVIPITSRAHDGDTNQRQDTFTVDAAVDMTTVGPAGRNVFFRGESFVVDAVLHPGGTLPSGLNAGNDPNEPPGIGKLRCRATVASADSMDFTSPFVTLVSELYSLPDETTNLLADGFGPNPGFTARRIVSGGTGRFRDMVGEIEETNLGLNKTGGCNLRITFKLTKAGHRHDQ